MKTIEPTLHLWYSERYVFIYKFVIHFITFIRYIRRHSNLMPACSIRVHDCNDALPKFLNFPESFGGDGKLHPEEAKQGGDNCGDNKCVIS